MLEVMGKLCVSRVTPVGRAISRFRPEWNLSWLVLYYVEIRKCESSRILLWMHSWGKRDCCLRDACGMEGENRFWTTC
jgi:hypothetical protein